MMLRLLSWAWFGTVLALGGEAAVAQSSVVYCHDVARQTVSRMLAHKCDGEVVSETRAAEIKAARIQRMQRALKGGPPPLVPDRELISVGTAFFVAADGKLLTNKHNVDKCDVNTVETTTGEQRRAQVLGVLERYDLALLAIDLAAPGTAAFRNGPGMRIGSRADLVGYPTQGIPPRKPFYTEGEIYRPEGTTIAASRFFVRGDVRPGNSGSPVLDETGHVIGIIHAKFNTAAIYQQTGKVMPDIGVAVRNRQIFDFLDRHKVRYQTGESVDVLDRQMAFDAAKPFVARVGCWR